MAGYRNNSKKHGDPNSDPHGSNQDSFSGASSRSGSDRTRASGSPPQEDEQSMGGSQGTPAEARAAASDRHSSKSSREDGGYGDDSGYSERSRKSTDRNGNDRDPGQTRDSRNASAGSDSRNAGQPSRSDHTSARPDTKPGRSR